MSSCICKFLKQYVLTLLLILFTLPVFAKNTILIVGDSLSAGYGLQAGEGWVSLLKSRLAENDYQYTLVNLSVSGDTTSNGLAKLPAALQEYHPAVTLIELGGNDGLRGIQLVAIKKNLQQMITLTKQAGSAIILLGVRLPPNYGEAYIKQFQEIYQTLAASNQLSLVPNLLQGVDDHPELMSDDGIHPVAKAQTIILDTVWTKLVPHLSKK